MRLVLQRLNEQGISMPDEQREIVFPQDVPVRILRTEHRIDEKPPMEKRSQPAEALVNEAEDNLRSDADKMQQQAGNSRAPDNGTVDLLANPAASTALPTEGKAYGGSKKP